MDNRREMIRLVLDELKKVLPKFAISEEAMNCHHNDVSIENHFGDNVYITRQAAISAYEGELGIIPGSTVARPSIVRGKGNIGSFCTRSHAACRSHDESRKDSMPFQNRTWRHRQQLLNAGRIVMFLKIAGS